MALSKTYQPIANDASTARTPASDELRIINRTENAVLTGWQAVRISRGIERMPSDFEVSLTQKVPDRFWCPLKAGDEIQVSIGSDVVLTGYVDRMSVSLSSDTHQVAIAGRSKTCDLIDASAEIRDWRGYRQGDTLMSLAEELARPYGIEVRSNLPAGAMPTFPTFTANLGESAYEILERVARYCGVLVTDDVDGALLLTRIQEVTLPDVVTINGQLAEGNLKSAGIRVGVQQGINVQRAVRHVSVSSRFSRYTVFPQSVETQRDQTAALGVTIPDAFCEDEYLGRNRQLYIISEQYDLGQSLAQRRAIWECNRRAGRGQATLATVDSWRDRDGKLWEPGSFVYTYIEAVDQSGYPLVVADVTFTRDVETGTTATLTLMEPAAFAIAPMSLAPTTWDQTQALQEAGAITQPVAGGHH
ncbi:phage baseplate assembly protein [Roseicella sp. DB1501]|uniref:phage baseplate assembly protein n=1 Tax=Roseicella sp. DB1501 TaxID=2730925 RepID=UPI0014921497|nr:hypothetical protein [Roseicella sp. DB1501]NOG69818.1 hypothetical protein [Roseicella sp. DB1501]